MLRPGNVYVWEEKGPSGGENGYQVCIERWTEGLSWSASRIRECVSLFSSSSSFSFLFSLLT